MSHDRLEHSEGRHNLERKNDPIETWRARPYAPGVFEPIPSFNYDEQLHAGGDAYLASKFDSLEGEPIKLKSQISGYQRILEFKLLPNGMAVVRGVKPQFADIDILNWSYSIQSGERLLSALEKEKEQLAQRRDQVSRTLESLSREHDGFSQGALKIKSILESLGLNQSR